MAYSAEEEYGMEPPRLTREEEEQLVQRLYDQSIQRKQATLAELENRYYPTEEPRKISEEQLKKSIERQVDTEMQLRKARAAEADATVYHRASSHNRGAAASRGGGGQPREKLSAAEVEDSVRRLYDESLAHQTASKEESNRRFLFDPSSIKTAKMPKSAIQDSVSRLSKPKKTEYTTEEINRVYGLAPPAK